MGDEIKYLTTTNGKYPFVYSLNVMEIIQNEYGSLTAWGDLVEPKDGSEPKIEALLLFFKEAINEGIDIENEKYGASRHFITKKSAGRIISELGLEESAKKLKEVVVESTKIENQESSNHDSKNGISTQSL